MNNAISKLYHIAQQQKRTIIGLMSGTSLDGLDIALCEISGHGKNTNLSLLNFVTVEYDADFKNKIRKVFAQKLVDQEYLCGLNALIGKEHAKLINDTLQKWNIKPEDVDLIASHGQTIYHAPRSFTKNDSLPNSTLQIGDGDHIAMATGIITLSDFRQKHIAGGGEGAPLAAYGDFLLFTSTDEDRILLNIGGISNLTFLPREGSSEQAYATDLGPGNTMMNQYMKRQFDEEMDRDAQVAKAGEVYESLLQELLSVPFLQETFPKTTGPELFNLTLLEKALTAIGAPLAPPKDIMATLCAYTAEVCFRGIKSATAQSSNFGVYMSGGGMHNPLLVELLQKKLPQTKITTVEEIGMNPDAKEACLFAILANETVAGNPQNVYKIKDSPAVCMGKISLPY